jgi:hypothetical protein
MNLSRQYVYPMGFQNPNFCLYNRSKIRTRKEDAGTETTASTNQKT